MIFSCVYGCISPKVMTHHLVPHLLIHSTIFYHIPELGPCTYPCSINIVPSCTSSLKLGLLSTLLQSNFLVYEDSSSPIRRELCHLKFFAYKDLIILETVWITVQDCPLSLPKLPTERTSVSS